MVIGGPGFPMLNIRRLFFQRALGPCAYYGITELPYLKIHLESEIVGRRCHFVHIFVIRFQQYLRPVQDPTDLDLSGYCFKFGIATSSSG